MARILVIDDDDEVRRMLKQALERAGYDVAEAQDSTTGLSECRSRTIDLVITDILLPDHDGTITIRKMMREFPALKIIAISGGGDMAGPDSCLNVAKRVGAQCTFSKPLHINELLDAVRKLSS
ncbi:MAG: response regulator [Pseudomonadota bacterium]